MSPDRYWLLKSIRFFPKDMRPGDWEKIVGVQVTREYSGNLTVDLQLSGGPGATELRRFELIDGKWFVIGSSHE